MTMVLVLAALPVLLLVAGLPIYLVLLATSIAGMTLFVNIPMTAIPQMMFGSLDKFSLLAVPFFIFAGEIMLQGGVSRRIIDWILNIFGRVRSVRPVTTVAASEFFGAISGSSPATVAAVGKFMYPSLREGGYNERFSLGLVTSAGAVASVMPPSIALILYGAVAEQSIAALFAAGVAPAFLLGLTTVVYVVWYTHIHSQEIVKAPHSYSLRHFARHTLAVLPALGTPVIILGGIYSGVFSPTESAGVAGIYGLAVGKFIYGEVTWTSILEAVQTSVRLTGQIFLVVAAAGVYSWLLTTTGVPQMLVEFLGDGQMGPWAILLSINILLLIVGCAIDPVSAIVLFTPLLLPIAQSIDIDLVHFGIIVAANLSIGMFTPPFGLNIFTSQAIFDCKVSTISRGVIPFILLQIGALLVVTYIPIISLYGAELLR